MKPPRVALPGLHAGQLPGLHPFTTTFERLPECRCSVTVVHVGYYADSPESEVSVLFSTGCRDLHHPCHKAGAEGGQGFRGPWEG